MIGNKRKLPTSRLFSIQGDNPFAANNLAYLLLEHGGGERVPLVWSDWSPPGMSKSPNSADTLAWAYFHTGAYTAAASLLEDAVKCLANPTYRYHLGMVYRN